MPALLFTILFLSLPAQAKEKEFDLPLSAKCQVNFSYLSEKTNLKPSAKQKASIDRVATEANEIPSNEAADGQVLLRIMREDGKADWSVGTAKAVEIAPDYKVTIFTDTHGKQFFFMIPMNIPLPLFIA